MTWGELLDEEQERVEQNYYICSPLVYNVSELTMRSTKPNDGNGKYLVKAPRRIINEFLKWLQYEKGMVMECKTNTQILSSWREFLNTQIL